MNAEMLFAAIGLAACVALLGRMAIGPRRRDKVDASVRRLWRAVKLGVRSAWRRREVRDDATREAREVIDRARRGKPRVDREGNVYRPRSFNDSGSKDAPDGRQRRDH
jgi:hypothetical protein